MNEIKPYYQESATTIYCGHGIDVLKQLPDESVQMCITSPPYWGLRNYSGGSEIIWGGNENCEHEWGELLPEHHPRQVEQTKWKNAQAAGHGQTAPSGQWCLKCHCWRGQLGLEPTPELYVEHLMMIFREVKRVLRKDGSFYLNIGDTYTSGKGSCFNPGGGNKSWQSWIDRKVNYPTGRSAPNRMYQGIPPKCMTCIPERVMFAMIEDNWVLRNKIIWHKPNAMPSSVKDRFTTTWEYLYFFTKARKYYFDLDSVRVPHSTQSLERYQRGVNLDRPAIGKSAEVGPMQQYKRAPQWFQEMFPPDEEYKGKFDDLFGHGPNPQSFNLRVRDVKRGKGGATVQSGELKASEKEIEEYEYPEKLTARQESIVGHFEQKGSGGHYLYGGIESPEGTHEHPKGKNPGDVIQIGADTHRKKRSITDARKEGHWGEDHPSKDPDRWFGDSGKNPGDYWELTTQPYKGAHFAVFPERLCERPIKASSRIGDIVLDPFSGSGTVGVAAKRLGRRSILIDCVKEYCQLSKDRIIKVEYQPGLRI